MNRIWASLVALPLILICPQVSAHEDAGDAEANVEIPADDFGRGTPFRSSAGFIAAVDSGDYELAAEYLDLRNLQGEASNMTGAQLARRLWVIGSRATWVDVDELVDDPNGRSNDELPSYRDSIGVILDGNKEIRLLLQKVPRGDGASIWKVSNATVSLIPALYATYGYSEPVENLRRNLPQVTVLGYELFKWVIILAVALITYIIVFLIALAIRRSLRASDTVDAQRIFGFLILPFAVWLIIILVNAVAQSLGTGATAEKWQQLTPIPTLITVWVSYVGINMLRDLYAIRLQKRGRHGAAVLLRPVTSALKTLLCIAAVLAYLSQIGINITTVVAGLGVGGIAIALAFQKPLEDIFGAITLYTQQPVRVGDFCRIGDETGTIEEIGLRTTRLRTLANTVIAVPNAMLANQPIDNISARKKIWYRPVLRLRYDTSPAKLEEVLNGIRALLESHEDILPDGQRVRFKEISTDALLVEVNAYVNTSDWAQYLKAAEQLNISILQIVSEAGTSLALPSSTMHIAGATGKDGMPAE